MVRQLKNLIAKEVSLVDRAANRRRFLITKNQEGSNMDDVLKSVIDTDLENEAKVDDVLKAAGLSEQASAAAKAAVRLLSAYKDELPDEVVKSVFETAGFPDGIVKACGDKGDMKKAKAPTAAECAAAEAEAESKDEADAEAEAAKKFPFQKGKKVAKEAIPVPVRKADGTYDFSQIPDEYRPVVEAVFKEADSAIQKAAQLEGQLKAAKDEADTKTFIAKAASEYGHLAGVKPEEFGIVLKSLAVMDPVNFAKLEVVLKAADEAAIQLTKPIGKSGEGSGSAWGRIEAAANALVAKSESKFSFAQAVDQITKDQPELYKAYLDEQKAK